MAEKALSPQRAAYLRALHRRRTSIRFLQAFLLVAFLLLWELAACLEWIDPFIFSCPSRVAETLCSIESQTHDILFNEQFHNYRQDFQQWAKDPILLLDRGCCGAVVTLFTGDNMIL